MSLRHLIPGVLVLAFPLSAALAQALPDTPSATLGPQAADLENQDTPVMLAFGNSVASRGRILLVGMPDHFPNGRVAVFTRDDAGTWQRTGTIDEVGGVQLDFDGHFAAISDGTNVRVYRKTNGGFQLTDTLTPGSSLEVLGVSVALRKGLLAVGGITKGDTLGNNPVGFVNVYRIDGDGNAHLKDKLTSSDSKPYDGFGISVGLADETMVVGSTGGTPSGAAYVFAKHGAHWTQQTRLTGSDATEGARFGESVAMRKRTIVVGAPSTPNPDNDPENPSNGATYVYKLSHGTWSQTQKVLPPQGDACQGSTVAIGQGLVAISAPCATPGRTGDPAHLEIHRWVGGQLQLAEVIEGPGSIGTSLEFRRGRLTVGIPTAYEFVPPPGQVWIFDLPLNFEDAE